MQNNIDRTFAESYNIFERGFFKCGQKRETDARVQGQLKVTQGDNNLRINANSNNEVGAKAQTENNFLQNHGWYNMNKGKQGDMKFKWPVWGDQLSVQVRSKLVDSAQKHFAGAEYGKFEPGKDAYKYFNGISELDSDPEICFEAGYKGTNGLKVAAKAEVEKDEKKVKTNHFDRGVLWNIRFNEYIKQRLIDNGHADLTKDPHFEKKDEIIFGLRMHMLRDFNTSTTKELTLRYYAMRRITNFNLANFYYQPEIEHYDKLNFPLAFFLVPYVNMWKWIRDVGAKVTPWKGQIETPYDITMGAMLHWNLQTSTRIGT